MSSEIVPNQKHTTEEIKTLLELPFRAAEITWRVLGDGERAEGEARIIPYAYRAAYMRRLDILFGPGGWTQSFSMTTVSNIQRSKKVNKAYAMITTGKILVTSTITIEGFGTRSSTGEGWADDENGTTRAQAQAFRRACAEFGLGRYLRELEGWSCKVPVDTKGYFKRPHFSVLPDSAIHPSELAEAQEVRARAAKSSRKSAAHEPLITSVVTGLSELYANGRMAGNLVNDVFFNLDRAVDLIDQINTMEPMLPSDNTLSSILHSYSAKALSDLQSFGDLKAVSRKVTTIYQAEQERQHGTTAA